MKIVIIPGLGATPDNIDDVIASTGLDEITLRDTNIDYIRKHSITGGYEGSSRGDLERHLSNLGWKQWRYDENIWLKPGHKCFSETIPTSREIRALFARRRIRTRIRTSTISI